MENLRTTVAVGNEIYEKHGPGNFFPDKTKIENGRLQVLKRLTGLAMIDGIMVVDADRKAAEAL